MFKWLKNKASGKPEQPQKDMLEFVGGITGDAVSAVTKVTLQVNLLARNGTLNRQSLFLADNFVREQVRELEREFVFGGNLPQEVLSITLLRYCSVFASAYASIFFNREEGNPETVSAVRAMRLLATHRRYARLAYRRSPPKVDSTMVKIFREAKSAGIADFRVPAYLGESRTSVSSEFAVSALFESAPLDNFAREQIEYFWRLLQHYSNRIPMKPYPGNLVPFAIGKDGKTYLDVPPIKTRAFQYVGPGIWALEAIEQTAKETGGAKMLKRFGEVLPGTDADTVVSMAKKVLAIWKGEKNRRRHERVVPEKSLTLLVVEGFSLVHRMVAYSEFVNSGGTLGASDGLKIIQLQRVTHIQSIVPKLVVSGQDRSEPREILTKLECASDNGFIERWYVSDQSESGVGLYVPGHRSWLSVGHLIAVRDERSTEWRVGIVRRISTVESGRTVGIEYLSKSAIPVRIKRHDDGASTSNAGRSGELFDGILTEGKENHLLAPARRVEGSRQLVFGSGKCLHAEMGAKINGARGIDGYSCSVRLI